MNTLFPRAQYLPQNCPGPPIYIKLPNHKHILYPLQCPVIFCSIQTNLTVSLVLFYILGSLNLGQMHSVLMNCSKHTVILSAISSYILSARWPQLRQHNGTKVYKSRFKHMLVKSTFNLDYYSASTKQYSNILQLHIRNEISSSNRCTNRLQMQHLLSW